MNGILPYEDETLLLELKNKQTNKTIVDINLY